MYETILFEKSNGVATIVLNRPDKLNSFNGALHEEILDALNRAATDDDVQCIVLRGEGKGFSAGADLAEVIEGDGDPSGLDLGEYWFREHDPRRHPIWVAEDGGKIACWMSLSPFYDGRPAYHATAEVGVYVSENHRRKGLGRRLVGEAIRRVSALGLKTLTAGAFAHNGPSLRLFESFGFEHWAHFPKVAELDGIERDLVVLGLRLDGPQPSVSR